MWKYIFLKLFVRIEFRLILGWISKIVYKDIIFSFIFLVEGWFLSLGWFFFRKRVDINFDLLKKRK